MESALASGALDVIGVARPMALVPDYPRRVLAGETVPRVAARRLGLRSLEHLEGASELAWYYHQIARLGRGLEPDPSASAFRALAAFLASDAAASTRRRIARLFTGASTRAPLRALPERTRQ
jgi:hypothetical protein